MVAGSAGDRFQPKALGTYTLVIEAEDDGGNKSTKRIQVRTVEVGSMPDSLDGYPAVDEILPGDGSQEIMVTTPIIVTFSEPVERSSLTDSSFYLLDIATQQPVPAYIYTSIEGGRMRATLQPKRNLKYDGEYMLVLTTAIIDLPNNPSFNDQSLPLENEVRASFKTKAPKAFDLTAAQFEKGWAVDLYTHAVSGRTYAYVAARDVGWRVIDVTDPTKPLVVYEWNYQQGSVKITCRSLSVDQQTGVLALVEDFAFGFGRERTGMIRFYDLNQSPEEPVVFGREKLAEGFSGIPGRLDLYGGFAYVATVGVGLQVVDITAARNDSGPSDGSSIIGYYDSLSPGYGHPNDIFVYPGGRAVVTTNSRYLLVLDLSNPAFPTLLSAFRPDGYGAARAAVTSEYSFIDSAGNNQVIDLAVTGSYMGQINTVDLTSPLNPKVIGVAKDDQGNQVYSLPSDIVINGPAGMAFVSTFSSIQVFDIKDPYNPLLLHNIANLPDENGNFIPIGSTPGLVEKDGWVYMANMNSGMRVLNLDPVFLEHWCLDGEFQSQNGETQTVSQEFCSDYYPALGEKEILLLGRDWTWVGKLEAPVQVKVSNTAELKAQGVTVSAQRGSQVDKATFNGGIAKFYVQSPKGIKADELNIEFEVDPSSLAGLNSWPNIFKGDSHRVTVRLEVRDNSNVTMRDVLAGEAVFVADYFDKDHKSTGAYTENVKISEIEDDDKKFVFVQELLNQVVSRKRSVVGYNLTGEDGQYGGGAVTAVQQFRENFEMGNTHVDFTPQPDGTVKYTESVSAMDPAVPDDTNDIFRKLSKDYGIRAQGTDATTNWLHKIVDKETLVGQTKKLRSDGISYPDVSIGGDTGLYELYGNVVAPFVTEMMATAQSYADYTGVEWFDRGAEDENATKRTGISYSYGAKQTIKQFKEAVSTQCVTPRSDTTKSKITLWYKDDKGAVDLESFGERVVTTKVLTGYNGVNESAATCPSAIGGQKRYPGLYRDELRSYNKGNKKRFTDAALTQAYPTYPQFKADKWAGIDCMGLVLRSIEGSISNLATKENLTLQLPSFTLAIYNSTNIDDTIYSDNGFNWLSTSGFNQRGGLVDDNGYTWIDKDTGKEWIKKGDVALYGGHISIVHSARYGESKKAGNYDIVHASGIPCISTGRDGECKSGQFSRKVLVTKDLIPGMSAPKGFGRIKLWE